MIDCLRLAIEGIIGTFAIHSIFSSLGFFAFIITVITFLVRGFIAHGLLTILIAFRSFLID